MHSVLKVSSNLAFRTAYTFDVVLNNDYRADLRNAFGEDS